MAILAHRCYLKSSYDMCDIEVCLPLCVEMVMFINELFHARNAAKFQQRHRQWGHQIQL